MSDENNKEITELKKLKLEVKLLESKSHWSNNLTSKFIPLIVTFSGAILSYLSFFLPFQLQSKNQEYSTLIDLIKQATTSSTAEGRIAGIWMLNSYWEKREAATNQLLANALSGIIMSDPEPIVRMTAAEVIGKAYSKSDWDQNNEDQNKILISLRETLYGNGKTGEYGSITYANWWLGKECNNNVESQLDKIDPKENKSLQNDEVNKLCKSGLVATREAIRKNWENLEDIHLGDTDLTNARLYESNLRGANFKSSILKGANLKNSDLSRTILLDTQLQDVKNLEGAIFEGAIYNDKKKFPKGFDFSSAKMYLISPGSDLQNSNLSNFPLNGADLSKSNLKNADLSNANLESARFSGSNLTGADFSGANILGTDFRGTDLSNTNFKDAKYNSQTLWPTNFLPKK